MCGKGMKVMNVQGVEGNEDRSVTGCATYRAIL